jgi:DNA-binding beta-propeller fold protein YncE
MRRPLRSWWIWHGDAGGLPGGTSLLANLRALATNAANDRQTSFPADQRPTPENYPTGFAHQVVDYVFNRRIWQPTASEQVLIAYRQPASSTAQSGGRIVNFHPANLVIGEGLLSAPRGLTALPGGGVAVADSGHGRIVKFGSDGAFLGEFGQNILIPTLTGPESLIFRSDPASSVTAIVADTWGHALRMFSAEGSLLLSRAAGRDATGRISLYGPRGLASDAMGRLLVTDTGNHVVRVFDREFRALASWGRPGQGPGEFREPVGIVVGRDDWVYVADAGNGRVQRFTPRGVFDRAYAWAQPGDPANVDTVGLEPQLALLDDGRIAVSLSVLGEVRVLEPGSGQWSVWLVSRPGVQEPLGLAADGQGGLWIADRAAQRIVRIRQEK